MPRAAKWRLDRVAQEDADVAGRDVARGIRSPASGSRSCPAPSATTITAWPRRARRSSSAARNAGEGERHLGHQAEVDLAVGERRAGGDETGVAPHQLDQADAVARAGRLGVRCVGCAPRLGDRGLEAERLLDERDVVVDRLRDADRRRSSACARAASSAIAWRAAQRAVAADREEHVDALALQGVDHLADVLRSARGAEDRAAHLVDVADPLRRQLERRMAVARHQPLVAVAETRSTRARRSGGGGS